MRILMLVTALSIIPSAAQAGITLGAEYKLGVPVGSDVYKTSANHGIEGRLGYGLNLVAIKVIPEIAVGFAGFAPEDSVLLDETTKMWYFKAGGRVGIGAGVMPFGYAHVGYGNASISSAVSDGGALFDAGLGLMFTALPLVDFGVSAGYNQVKFSDAGDSLKWIDVAAHVAVNF